MRLSSSAISLLALLALSACHRELETQRVPPPVVQDSTVRFPAGSPQLALLHTEQVTQQRTETLVLATHDLEVAGTVCRRALALSGGSVAYDGPLDRLLADPGRVEQLGLSAPL